MCVEQDSSTGTLHSYKNIEAELSYGDMFIADKPSEPETEKTADDRDEAISMVDVPIVEASTTVTTSTAAAPTPSPPVSAHSPSITTKATTTTTLPISAPEQEAILKFQSGIFNQLDVLSKTTKGLIENSKEMEETLAKHNNSLHSLDSLNLPQTISSIKSRLYKLERQLMNKLRKLSNKLLKPLSVLDSMIYRPKI